MFRTEFYSHIQSFLANFSHFVFCLQSKLNCEVLHEPLGYEARWAIAGDSIVVQLVAKLGKNY